MSKLAASVLLLVLAVHTSACFAAPKVITVGRSALRLDLPTGWTVERQAGQTLAKRVNANACLTFSLAGERRDVGSVCEFGNSAALESIGVVLASTLPSQAIAGMPADTVWVSLSGLSVNPMENSVGRNAVEGARDCDESDGVVYRASATCFVHVKFLNRGRVLFFEFLLTDDMNKKVVVSAKEIRQLLSKPDDIR